MEIKSEPAYVEEHWTDIDVAFVGRTMSFSLKEGTDSYSKIEGPHGVAFVIELRSGNQHEDAVVYMQHAQGYSIRERTMKRSVQSDA